MKKVIKFGEVVNDGVTKDINAVIIQTEDSFTIRGEHPYGGHPPPKYLSIPDGFRGVSCVHRCAGLAEMVAVEENTIFRMGSPLSVVYYEYKGGMYHGYYSIEEVE